MNRYRRGQLRRSAHALLGTILLVVFATSSVVAADRDGDGLRDGFEQEHGVTSPARADTDGDGVVDSAEDSDGDRLGNLGEQRFGTSPRRRDTDGDGTGDGAEDHDGDGRPNALQQDQRPVPKGLRPSLSEAHRDRAAVAKRCFARRGASRLVRCKFGPKGADTHIVLVGDSHARLLIDPLRRAAEAEGWRLVAMVKTSCIPIPGVVYADRYAADGGRACRAWRKRMVSAIQGTRPDLVIVTSSAGGKLVSDQGRDVPKSRRPAVWRQGLGRLLSQMPKSTDVLFLGDVPWNRVDPVTCLRQHRDDMSKCVTRRGTLEQRPIERAQRAAVARHGQHFGSLHRKICTYDPCPVVQGRVLIYRDGGHLSAAFARQMTPSLRRLVRTALVRP